MEQLLEFYGTLGVSPAVYGYGEAVLEKLRQRFEKIDKIA